MFFVRHGIEVIRVSAAEARTVIFHPGIEFYYLFGRLQTSLPGIVESRSHRSQDHVDAVCLRDFGHGLQVVLNHLESRRSRVSCNIVGPTVDDDHLGLQVNDILPKAEEHLWSRLTANAATHIRFTRKELLGPLGPQVRNRVAYKDGLYRMRNRSVQGLITSKVRPVPHHLFLPRLDSCSPFFRRRCNRRLLRWRWGWG